MQRTLNYRGLDIYIELRPTSKDMFEPWLRIDGATRDAGTAAFGTLIKVRGGPYSRRWAYFVAEIAGQTSIDLILCPEG
ncbi:hypothetical protein NDK50_14990 [Paraburkholderia bryophila]|uniref:hypothetical protein n=1 Tax=Paraburkholderia bryophila TaxID=420952 RepID=UPI00234AC5E5|nr:hypothetical protein [Paraburkholderia bryophila]WCM18738.1 hypothetical protein NDK50_14990 [Paraburkholderia bryophila]